MLDEIEDYFDNMLNPWKRDFQIITSILCIISVIVALTCC